jgi:hypothetical protein
LNECAMNTRGKVRIIRQLSNTRCVENVNWGTNRNSVWVKDGCRAIFESDSQSGSSSNLPRRATCESKDERLNQCAMDTRGTVRVVRQISNTRCVENVNWGINSNSVWVKDGCRAEFESTGGYSGGGGGYNPSGNLPTRVTCESEDGRMRECAMNTRGDVRIVRQISNTRCVEGRNWGTSRNSVWVKDGCRAEFELRSGYSGGGNNYPPPSGNLPTRVRCESEGGQKKECDMNTRGVVRVVQQLSSTRCIEGQNWGRNRTSIWVNNGCRAVFELEDSGGSSSNAGAPPDSLIRACNAVQDRYGKVVSYTPLKPGAWEIILNYSDGNYVCNVERDGRVTYFEKLKR